MTKLFLLVAGVFLIPVGLPKLGMNIRVEGTDQTHIFRCVRFGSLAYIKERQSHVRFTPESRHASAPVACPLSANSGHPSCPSQPSSGPPKRQRIGGPH